jgi:uncharacterized protein
VAAHTVLSGFPYWRRLTAIHDVLIKPTEQPSPNRPTGLQTTLLDAWADPFAWLLIAEPIGPAAATEHISAAAEAERDARTRASSPQYQLLAERAADRHRELRAGESTGLWRLHVLAGATDAATCEAFAGHLGAALSATSPAYALTPANQTGGDLASCLATAADGPSGATSPTIVGTGLLAGLARPPDAEIPGVRVTRRPAFDVTPETVNGAVHLGTVLDQTGRPAGPIAVSTDNLVRHSFVTGATGAGKTRTIQHLLGQAAEAGISWLVIEPAKAEYRHRLRDAEVVIIRPGDPDLPAVGFNPLQPARGFPLQTHADLVRALFTAAFQAEEPFPQILAAALTRCYQRTGWDTTLSQPRTAGLQPRWPNLADLQQAADEIITGAGYGPEVEANVRGFVTVRLGSLRHGSTGAFFDSSRHIDFESLLARNVILEIEDVGDDLDKAFFIGAMLLQLTEHLRARHRHSPGDGNLCHLTVIEEAHRLLRRTEHNGAAAHAVETFAHLLAEIRAYGEGLIIADQIPAKLIPDVIKNTAVKIVHRLPAADDRDSVGATMGMTEPQSGHLIAVPPGVAAIHVDGMDRPVLARIPSPTQLPPAREPVSPLALVTTVSAACPQSCRNQTCTLRDESLARYLLEEHPAIAMWCDLAVLAHLVALPVPSPGPTLQATLAVLDQRQLMCALQHGVRLRVEARTAAICRTHSPAELHTHVTADLIRLSGTGLGCPDELTTHAIASYRGNAIRLELARLIDQKPNADPHPDTPTWLHRYGLTATGPTAAQQLRAVSSDLRRTEQTPIHRTVVFGAPPALGDHTTDPKSSEWTNMVADLLDEYYLEFDWTHAYLIEEP